MALYTCYCNKCMLIIMQSGYFSKKIKWQTLPFVFFHISTIGLKMYCQSSDDIKVW